MVRPISSVTGSDSVEQIIKWDPVRHAFRQTFTFQADSRVCIPNDSIGYLSLRSYAFQNPLLIDISETTYQFDCEHFEWRGPIEGMKKKSIFGMREWIENFISLK
ncbi:MAG: hypothetical protein AAF206_01380 [Bacteroidota bacterium]